MDFINRNSMMFHGAATPSRPVSRASSTTTEIPGIPRSLSREVEHIKGLVARANLDQRGIGGSITATIFSWGARQETVTQAHILQELDGLKRRIRAETRPTPIRTIEDDPETEIESEAEEDDFERDNESESLRAELRLVREQREQLLAAAEERVDKLIDEKEALEAQLESCRSDHGTVMARDNAHAEDAAAHNAVITLLEATHAQHIQELERSHLETIKHERLTARSDVQAREHHRQELERALADLRQHRQDDLQAANSRYQDLEAETARAYGQLEAKFNALQIQYTFLATEKSDGDKQHAEEGATLRARQAALISELANAEKRYAEEIAATHAQQEALADAKSRMEAQQREKINALTSETAELTLKKSQADEKRVKELDTLRSQLATAVAEKAGADERHVDENIALEEEHSAALLQLRQELEAREKQKEDAMAQQHEEAVTKSRAEHDNLLQEQSNKHEAAMRELQDKHDNALADQRTEHVTAAQGLEDRLVEERRRLAEQHQTEIVEQRTKHAESQQHAELQLAKELAERDETTAALKTEHARTLASLEEKHEAERNQLLDERDRALKDSADAAAQSRSISDLEDQHQRERAQWKQQAAALEQEGQRAVAQKNKELDSAIAEMKAKHQTEMSAQDDQLRRIQQEHEEKLADVQRRYADEIANVKREAEKGRTQIVKDYADRMSKLEESHEAFKAEAADLLDAASDANFEQCDELRESQLVALQRVREDHAAELASMTKQHHDEIAGLKAEHVVMLETADKRHVEVLDDLNINHDRAVSQMRTELAQVKEDLSTSNSAMELSSKEHAERLSNLRDELQTSQQNAAKLLESRLSELSATLATKHVEETKSVHDEYTKRTDELRLQLSNAQAERDRGLKEYASLATSHATEIAKLETAIHKLAEGNADSSVSSTVDRTASGYGGADREPSVNVSAKLHESTEQQTDASPADIAASGAATSTVGQTAVNTAEQLQRSFDNLKQQLASSQKDTAMLQTAHSRLTRENEILKDQLSILDGARTTPQTKYINRGMQTSSRIDVLGTPTRSSHRRNVSLPANVVPISPASPMHSKRSSIVFGPELISSVTGSPLNESTVRRDARPRTPTTPTMTASFANTDSPDTVSRRKTVKEFVQQSGDNLLEPGSVATANEILLSRAIREHVGDIQKARDKLAQQYQSKFDALLKEKEWLDKQVVLEQAAEFVKERDQVARNFLAKEKNETMAGPARPEYSIESVEQALVHKYNRRIAKRKSQIRLKHAEDFHDLTQDYDRRLADLVFQKSEMDDLGFGQLEIPDDSDETTRPARTATAARRSRKSNSSLPRAVKRLPSFTKEKEEPLPRLTRTPSGGKERLTVGTALTEKQSSGSSSSGGPKQVVRQRSLLRLKPSGPSRSGSGLCSVDDDNDSPLRPIASEHPDSDQAGDADEFGKQNRGLRRSSGVVQRVASLSHDGQSLSGKSIRQSSGPVRAGNEA